MFAAFLKFELAHWLRGKMVYGFFLAVALFVCSIAANDNVQLAQSMENVNFNAPFRIQSYYAELTLLCGLIVTAFVCASAIRDFRFDTAEVMFAKPIDKNSYLGGRFLGAVICAALPLLAVSLGVFVACRLPGIDLDRVGVETWEAHLWGILLFALPNTLLIAALMFSVSLWLRSTVAAFVTLLVLLVGYLIAAQLSGRLELEWLVSLLDPFAIKTFSISTKYWTIGEKNSQCVGPNGWLLLNRVIWVSISLAILFLAFKKFQLVLPAKPRSKKEWKDLEIDSGFTSASLPTVDVSNSFSAKVSKFLAMLAFDLKGVIKSPVFLIVIGLGLINVFANLSFSASSYGSSTFPVTYKMVELIRGTFYLFLLVVIAFYSGQLVWKERDVAIDDVADALPTNTVVLMLGRILVMIFVTALLLGASASLAICVQLFNGYFRIQPGLYLVELLGIDLFTMTMMILLAFFAHTLAPNKMMGYGLFVLLAILNNFLWGFLKIESLMFQYGVLPNYTYSDMFGFQPYAKSIFWFVVYWLLFGANFCFLILIFWRRGRSQRIRDRFAVGTKRLRGSVGIAFGTTILLWLLCAGWVFYNTQILNQPVSQAEQELLRCSYEQEFGHLAKLNQPRITRISYEVDLFPKRRGLLFRGKQILQNKSSSPIEQLLVTINPDFENQIEVQGAREVENSNRHPVCRVFQFDSPLMPGDTATMKFEITREQRGFENQVTGLQFVQNGTFFDNTIAPQIGYQPSVELTSEKRRKALGLPSRSTEQRANPNSLANHYLSNNSDWVEVQTIISTSSDQTAIAPGKLVRTWRKDNRRYFEYRMEPTCLNFYSFVSGRYKVALHEWNGVDIEVYYHPDHAWNVENMLRSIQKSLEYFTREFGPYKHSHARIIEFPRTSSFAQAFPGTMPYSEGIGFISRINKNEGIDKVFYVVAHEIAHQWWAHQVIGANAAGATFLSETLAQYSSLMVMEKELGKDMMQRFLRYEMDRYLRGRGKELETEKPLAEVKMHQDYIHYRKGSIAMYHLKEMIGEERLNAALRNLIKKFAYKGPPYATSSDLIQLIREQTPEDLQYLIDDLFHRITLFENRVTNAVCQKLDNNQYKITIDFECRKFNALVDGNQKEVSLNDQIEIGAFAKPQRGELNGKTLFRKRIQVNQSHNQYSFVVSELPDRVGVDPFFLLIDKDPKDNLKRPKLK